MVNHLRKAMLVVVAMAALLAACAPASTTTTPEQVQAQVETSVALTVQAGSAQTAAAAQSLTSQAPAATATESPTAIVLNLSTDTPVATVTPFVVTPASGNTGGSLPAAPVQYACTWREVKPKINMFKPGDGFNVEWVITNTGTKTWPSKLDFNFFAGTQMSSYTGQELPPLKPGDTVTINFGATAPIKPGFYAMEFKVQGGLCFPSLQIEVGKPKDP